MEIDRQTANEWLQKQPLYEVLETLEVDQIDVKADMVYKYDESISLEKLLQICGISEEEVKRHYIDKLESLREDKILTAYREHLEDCEIEMEEN